MIRLKRSISPRSEFMPRYTRMPQKTRLMRWKRIFIRLCCRSKVCWHPEPCSECKGQSLPIALVMLLFVLPLLLGIYQFVIRSHKSAIQEGRQKTASANVSNVFMDYMRQFSQSAYNGHYDVASLQRPVMNYGLGYSTVTFQADPTNHTVYLRVEGGSGSSGSPSAKKVANGLIYFQSDM